MGALIILLILWIILGVLSGWLVPKLFKSKPPYGLAADILACTVSIILLGLVEWLWLLPALKFTGALKLAAAIGDPWGLGLVVLWLIRKIKG